MDVDCADSNISKQLKGRKKKKFYTKIREQMEFYFSDSNLAKDNFLQNVIKSNPEGYVDLEVFKSFNKIKEVTDDVNAIVAALSKSAILQVNDEKTKVRRITQMGEPKNFDACTLYVEKLPSHADHKWIKDVFEHFGKVDYINIPRYKISNKIKGFAFIEFNDPESVIKACEFYKRSSGKETVESDDQDMNKKQKSATCSEKERKSRKRKMSSDIDDPPQKKEDDASEKSSNSKCLVKNADISDNDAKSKQAFSERKRKRDSDVDIEKPHKKMKQYDSQLPGHQTEVSKPDCVATGKQQPAIPAGNLSGHETANSGDEAGKSKKKRKHKKKSHHHSEKPVLRVMSKHEWKAYRNKYLDLQRSTMSYLKKQIALETLELKELETVDEKSGNGTSSKGLQFQSGVVLKIILKDSITDPVDIKEKVKAAAHVAYVDAKLGHSEMFVRCHTPEEAHFIIQEKKLDDFGAISLLKDTEEKVYWAKIDEDRKAKFSTPLVRKKRGRDKIIAKATKLAEHKNKHIYFDE